MYTVLLGSCTPICAIMDEIHPSKSDIANRLFWARNFRRIIKLQKRIGKLWYSSLFGSNGFWYEMCFKVTNDTFSCLQFAIYTRSRYHSYRHSISDPKYFSTKFVQKKIARHCKFSFIVYTLSTKLLDWRIWNLIDLKNIKPRPFKFLWLSGALAFRSTGFPEHWLSLGSTNHNAHLGRTALWLVGCIESWFSEKPVLWKCASPPENRNKWF